MSKPSGHVSQFERMALCHSCYTSNVLCNANPKTGLPECRDCQEKRRKP